MCRNSMMRSFRWVTASLAILAATGGHAALDTVFASAGHEPGLSGVKGILDESLWAAKPGSHGR